MTAPKISEYRIDANRMVRDYDAASLAGFIAELQEEHDKRTAILANLTLSYRELLKACKEISSADPKMLCADAGGWKHFVDVVKKAEKKKP